MENIALSEKPRVLLLWLIGVSAVNLGWATINSGLKIKPGTKLFGLNDKSKATLRNGLSELNYRWTFYGLKWFMDRYWFKIGRNIYDDSWKSICWPFSYDCRWPSLQLPPVRMKLMFSQLSEKNIMKHWLGLQLWHLFKYLRIDWSCEAK